jgi:hypothetical protein
VPARATRPEDRTAGVKANERPYVRGSLTRLSYRTPYGTVLAFFFFFFFLYRLRVRSRPSTQYSRDLPGFKRILNFEAN